MSKLRKGNKVEAIKPTAKNTSVLMRSSASVANGRKIKSVQGDKFQLEGDHVTWYYLKDFRKVSTRQPKPAPTETVKPSTVEYKVGDTVRLVSKRPDEWSSFGSMDKYLGREVTITEITKGQDAPFFRFKGDEGWSFTTDDIECLVNTKSQINTVMQNHTITRKQLKEIHPHVCSKWQTKIEEVIKSDLFADTFTVSYSLLTQAFDEASDKQQTMLQRYFPTFKKVSAIQEAVNKIGTTVFGYNVFIDEIKRLIFIPTPNANTNWSLEVFDYVKRFVEAYPKSYPVHNAPEKYRPVGLVGGSNPIVIQF